MRKRTITLYGHPVQMKSERLTESIFDRFDKNPKTQAVSVLVSLLSKSKMGLAAYTRRYHRQSYLLKKDKGFYRFTGKTTRDKLKQSGQIKKEH